MHGTDDAFEQEVRDLHRYLTDWLTGKAPKGDGYPNRLAEALANNFVVIHPSGTRGSKTEALRAFGAAHGEKAEDYALEVGKVEIRRLTEGLCLATYEEFHRGEPGRARISTAVLQIGRASCRERV